MRFFVMHHLHGRFCVRRGKATDRPQDMGLHFVGTQAECEDYVLTHDADEETARITAEREAYWSRIEASHRRAMGGF